MAHFEVVKKYEDAEINLPIRSTAHSAGYDFEVAEDTVIPAYSDMMDYIQDLFKDVDDANKPDRNHVYPLNEVKDFMKKCGTRPTLIPTGVKCYLDTDEYLELSVRSSTPLNHWLVMANSIGIIDSDYADNPDNEGHIFFQIINLSPFNILLHKGDKIGQGIIHKYITVDDDNAEGTREGGFGSTTK